MNDEVEASLAEAARGADAIRVREAWRRAVRSLPPGGGADAQDPGGCRARTALTASLVRALLVACKAEAATCVALGGFGRGELAPHSDVDLLVLRPPGGDTAAVEAFVRLLWDAGAPVGHAVRTLDGVVHSLGRDLTAATAALEGRYVAGSVAGFDALRRAVGQFLARDRDRFVQAKLAEADERHRARGNTVFLLAPDLKAGRGTLRDLQLARLLAVLKHDLEPGAQIPEGATTLTGPAGLVLPTLERADELLGQWLEMQQDEVHALGRAGRLLLSVRSALHELQEERGDRLEPAVQDRLARRFGHDDPKAAGGRLPVEAFMDEVYRAARRVDRALGRCRLRLTPVTPAVRARLIAPGVAAAGDEVLLDPPAPALADAPRIVADLFRQALRTHRRVHPRALEDVSRVVAAVGPANLRASQDALKGLREVLGGVKGVASVLRAMHESGWLGALLPEVGALECLAQADPYHAYTVDEHTLAVCKALEGEPGAPEREDRVREELLTRTSRRDLLRLSALLHDAGKVQGALGHVERGVALVPAVAWRFGLTPEEEHHVVFLVAEHLTLSRMAEKRDVDARTTVDDLLRVCGHDSERLDHLYLLTAADVRGVSPQALTRWKDYLLTRLYGHGRDALEGGAAARRPDSVDAWVAHLASRVGDQAALRTHLERCSRAYLADVEPDDVVLHLDLVGELAASERSGSQAGVAVRCSLDESCERVWVAARDRPGLFANLCAALSGSGCEILGATTFGRQDGVVFDRFAVLPPAEGAPVDRWPALARTIQAVLEGKQDPAALIARRVRREPPRRPGGALPPVRIRVGDDSSPDLTMIDVSAPDRVGLLHDLARALSRAGCDIRLAKVATKGDRAVDVFYVTGQDGRPLDDAARKSVQDALERAARTPEA